MLLPKRDWLILRARLRRFVSVAALPVMAMTTEAAPASAAAQDAEPTHEVAPDVASAGVIGMKDVATSGEADRVRDSLIAETGHTWKVRWFHRHLGPHTMPVAGHAIFWRPELFDLVEDFGTSRERESVQFGGLLLERKDSGDRLAVFAGKLAWWNETERAAGVEHEERMRKAAVLRAWIDEKVADHPDASRVLLSPRGRVERA
jgi:hypothetical protein